MIIRGFVAASGLITSPILPGAVGDFNFINGTYVWQGTSIAASDLIDQPDWIGAGGLSITADATAAEILYPGFTDYIAACDFTAVFEVETITEWVRASILYAQDSSGLYYADLRVYPLDQTRSYDSDNSITRTCYDDANGLAVGIHKIGFTVAADRQAIAVDGNAPVTDARGSALPVGGNGFSRFYFGGGPTNGTSMSFAAIKIRSLSMYAAQPDDVLPGLTR